MEIREKFKGFVCICLNVYTVYHNTISRLYTIKIWQYFP